MLYLITGVNGVGKSRFISKLVNASKNFYHIQGSSELMKQLKIKDGDYKKLRNFNDKIKKNAFKKIILNANKKYGGNLFKHAVIDAHILNIKKEKIIKVMDSSVIKLFSAVIYLYAKNNDILERIVKDDKKRDRAMFKTKNKENFQILNFYIKQFEETLENECLSTNTHFQKIPHFKNKTHLSIQMFDNIHKKILNKESNQEKD
ncbi:MAG: AAA family ATPase [Patescibacteria group bacterium]|nr:AAA family ATPase [Patescibacteria group bacterium]